MARQSIQDPAKRIDPKLAIYADCPRDLWRALEAFRAAKGARRAHAVRMLLAIALRQRGFLAPLLVPEDAAHLEDVHTFPWLAAPGATHRPPSKLAWFSRDPSRLTWATLLRAMEEETATPLAEVARRHGVSEVHAYRVFNRFDHWRKGSDHRPRLDPFAGRPREGTTIKGKRPKKRSNKNGKAG